MARPLLAILDYPPVWLAGSVLLAALAGRIWPHGPGWLIWPGILLVLAGIALILVAARTMRRARTTIDPYGQPAALVATGVFAHSRNPIYLGNAITLTGFCLLAGAPLTAILLVPLFIRVINRRFIQREEAQLRAAFPQQFDDYRRRTRRWI